MKCLLWALTSLLTGCAAFDRPDPVTIEGRVLDYPGGTPLASASVRVAGEDRTVTTDGLGRFALSGLAASVSLAFEAPDHVSATRSFNLSPGEDRAIDVPLPATGQHLAPRLVLFERGARIWSVDALGSDERCLTADLPDSQASPAWLSGRSQSAFLWRHPGRTQIWSRYPDGRPARFLGEVPDSATDLAWHPVGEYLAFAASYYLASRGIVTTLKRLDQISGVVSDFVSGGVEANPAWSVDGKSLAWARRVSPHPWQIWIGGERGEHPRLLPTRGSSFEPTWSPSGAQMAYASNDTGRYELYLAGVANGLVEQLTHSPEGGWCRHPVWAPEGDEILFESNYHPGLGKLQAAVGLYALRLNPPSIRAIAPDARAGTW